MKDLFFMGGPLFMGILSIIFMLMIAWMIYHFIRIKITSEQDKTAKLRLMSYGKSIGLFAMIIGILGQLIGLYDAFSVIEKIGDVSPAMLYGGLKVSMITTMYGIVIYILSLLIWFGMSQAVE
ncbi:MAG: MotA/TolQ/ExbB proton channel family protein [Saprospiraceae bacterium]